MEIVVVNLPCASPRHGPTYRTHHLAEAWVRRGHRVTFIGASYSHLLTQPPEFKEPWREFTENGVRYVILRTPRYQGSGLGRVLNLATGLAHLRRYSSAFLADRRPDVVMAASVYQLDNPWAADTARRHGGIFVRETRDLWPLTLTQLGGLPAWHPFVLWVQRGEFCAYRRAHLVSTTLSDSFEYMQGRGLDRDRWAYLPQCPPPEGSSQDTPELPRLHAEALEDLRARGQFVACFTGSLVPASDLGTLVQAVHRLATESVSLVLVGQGPSEAALQEQIRTLRATNVLILPPVPKAAVPRILSLAHVGVQLFADHPIYRYGVSPNKLFDYMRHGLPTILGCTSPNNPVSASGAGIVVAPSRPDEVANAIRTLKSLPGSERALMGRKAMDHMTRHHDIASVAEQYLVLFGAKAARRGRVPH